MNDFNSDILDVVLKKINVQELIDNWILKIDGNTKNYLDNIWYSVEDVLELAWFYKKFNFLKNINIRLIKNWINIEVFGKLYSFEYTIYFRV